MNTGLKSSLVGTSVLVLALIIWKILPGGDAIQPTQPSTPVASTQETVNIQSEEAPQETPEEAPLNEAEDESALEEENEQSELEAEISAQEEAEQQAAAEAQAQQEAAAAPKTLATGSFQTIQVGTSGSVSFIQEGNAQTIQISNLNTSSAPNLEIYLSKAGSISSSADISGAIKLTALRSPKGTQSYSVPAGIDLSQYNSIAIHCTEYNKLFGSASLK